VNGAQRRTWRQLAAVLTLVVSVWAGGLGSSLARAQAAVAAPVTVTAPVEADPAHPDLNDDTTPHTDRAVDSAQPTRTVLPRLRASVAGPSAPPSALTAAVTARVGARQAGRPATPRDGRHLLTRFCILRR